MIGDIDSTMPVGMTHLLERNHEIYQQHGGVVTGVRYDTLEEMSLDTFLKDVVPTIKDRKEKLCLIKDSVRQNIYRILDDNVAIFHYTNIEDVFLDAFMERLANEQPLAVTLNLTYPLIYYATGRDGDKRICVSIPEKQFTYHTVRNGVSPFVAWHPPLWLYMRMTAANVPTDVKIGVVLDRTDDAKDTTVYHLPLPNCGSSFGICFGSTHLTNPGGGALTEAAAIELTYQRLFNSEFNHDLTSNSEEDEYDRLCNTLPTAAEFRAELDHHSGGATRYAVRVKYAFSDRANLYKYHYRGSVRGEDFLKRI